MAKVAKHARPASSLPKKKSHAPPESAARAGGTSAASRLQEISRTASSLPMPTSTSSKSAMPTHPRLLNQSRYLRPTKLYPKDHLKASPKAMRTQRTTLGPPLFDVRTAPSPKSANRLQSSPLNRANASLASGKKTEPAQVNTRYSFSDLEMKTLSSIPSDDSSDDMPRNSGLDSKVTVKAAQALPKCSGPTMEPVQTFLRLRPPHPSAADQEESHSYVDILNNTDVLMTPPPSARAKSPSKYTFTKVFDPTATQKTVFNDACAPLLTPLLREDDSNAVLFAYGASASGKTHSIVGSNIPDQAGILPRTLDVLFKSIRAIATDSGEASQYRPAGYRDVEKVDPAGLGQSMKSEKDRRIQIKTFKRMAREFSKTPGLGGHTAGFEFPTREDRVDYNGNAISLPKGMDYTVWISCAELYTEKIYDLLADPAPGTQSLLFSAMSTKRRELYLKRDNSTGHKYIDGLKEVEVRTLEEALLVLSVGLGQRQVYSKLSNKYSSRSHCIFTIKVLKTPQFGSSATEDAAKGKTSVARLSIVDLAGPERFQGIKTTGQRPKEGGSINTSLMVLGHCMEVLRQNQKSSKIPQPVPFRHSILTQLFQCALEGKSASTRMTLLIATNPHGNEFDETTQTLRFASTPMDVSTPVKNDKQSFEDVISDLYEKIGAMEREREMMDGEIKAAVIEQVKNEVLSEMADRLRRERIETASAATQTPIPAPMDTSTTNPASSLIVAEHQTSITPTIDMDVQPLVPALTKLVSLRRASPVTCQDGSDEVHTDLGLISEINRLKRLLNEANQRNEAWQSWHLSAPCSAPLTAPRTAASPIHASSEMAMDLEEEPASTEDRLCVVVYQAEPEPTAESAEQERLIPLALEATVAEDTHDDEENATTMDHALGAADDVTSIDIESHGLPSHSQTTPDSEDDGMQSVDETDQLNFDESDGPNSDKEDAATTHCSTDSDPAESPALDNSVHEKDQLNSGENHGLNSVKEDAATTSFSTDLGPAEGPALDNSVHEKDQLNSDESNGLNSVKEDAATTGFSTDLGPAEGPALDNSVHEKDQLNSDESDGLNSVKEDAATTRCSTDLDPAEGPALDNSVHEKVPDVSHVNLAVETTNSDQDELIDDHSGPDEETTSSSPSSPRQNPSPGPQCAVVVADMPTEPCTHHESSPGSGSQFVSEDSEGQESSVLMPVLMPFFSRSMEVTVDSRDVSLVNEPEPTTFTPDEELDLEHGLRSPHNPPGSTYWGPNPFNPQDGAKNLEGVKDVKESENVREYEDVEEHENNKEYEDAQEYEDVKDYEDVDTYEDVKDYEDVETYEDVKDSEDVEKFEDLREYEDVSPVEEPLPETFALGASSPRSRSGSPYWDASSLSPQVITQEFEEPEPGQTILPPHTPSPQTPPRKTPPQHSPLASPAWEAGPFNFKLDDRYGSEAGADQVSTQLSAHEEARQPNDAHETLFVDIAPMTPKRKRKLRQKNAVFEEEMGESVGLPPPETMTRRKRTRKWD